jgi:hypothetical protein
MKQQTRELAIPGIEGVALATLNIKRSPVSKWPLSLTVNVSDFVPEFEKSTQNSGAKMYSQSMSMLYMCMM